MPLIPGKPLISEKYAESLLEQVSLSHWISKFPLIVPSTAPCGNLNHSHFICGSILTFNSTEVGYISLEAGKLLGSSYLEGLPIFHCCGDAGAVSLGFDFFSLKFEIIRLRENKEKFRT